MCHLCQVKSDPIFQFVFLPKTARRNNMTANETDEELCWCFEADYSNTVGPIAYTGT